MSHCAGCAPVRLPEWALATGSTPASTGSMTSPSTSRDQFMEAVLRVGPKAYLTHDAVLALHNLGLVNPRRIRVGTPRRARPRLPDYVEVVQLRLDPFDCRPLA